MPFIKKFAVVSLYNSFPMYLAVGRAPLHNNFTITGVDFHMSTTVTQAMLWDSETEAEITIGALLYSQPYFAPVNVVTLYFPE